MQIQVTGCGTYLPGPAIATADLLDQYPTGVSPDWVKEVTGIYHRHWAGESEASSDLGAKAAEVALEKAKLKASQLDYVLLATSTPDYVGLPGACNLLKKLGATCPATDIIAACAGSLHAFNFATGLLESGRAHNILVVAADCKSRFTDKEDETYLHIFGDGAAAFVLSRNDNSTETKGVQSLSLYGDGQFYGSFKIPAGGSAIPASKATVADGLHFMRADIEGKMVARHAIEIFAQITRSACKEANIQLDEIDYLVPHQPNLYILRKLAEELEFPMEKFVINIDRYGNTGAAAMPIGFAELLAGGAGTERVATGKKILLLSAGSGVTAGAMVYKS